MLRPLAMVSYYTLLVSTVTPLSAGGPGLAHVVSVTVQEAAE